MEAVAAFTIRMPTAPQSLISPPRKANLPAAQSLRWRVRNPSPSSSRRTGALTISASVENSSSSKKAVPNSNYVVPLDIPPASSCITRPLAEILRDLNKRVPDKVVKGDGAVEANYIPWYHANRMLSFFAPGWCGELRNVIFSADGRSVSVVYRVTIRGSDGESTDYSSTRWNIDVTQVGFQPPY
uniref:Uncharacterized protein n=1 Tax=Picea sitchensis TaxID=3332 RepID=A9NSX2_PICSI|nr:unknown [Picea sitchensis]